MLHNPPSSKQRNQIGQPHKPSLRLLSHDLLSDHLDLADDLCAWERRGMEELEGVDATALAGEGGYAVRVDYVGCLACVCADGDCSVGG